MPEQLLSNIFNFLAYPFTFVFSGSERIAWMYLFTSLLFGLWIFSKSGSKNGKAPKRSFKEIWAQCFPASIYFHPSAIVDYKFFYLNAFLLAFVVAPLFSSLDFLVSTQVQNLLTPLGLQGIFGNQPLLARALLTIGGILALDFGLYIAHYLQHRVPWLWEFHKVHHSAEVMTPITVYRMHPVDDAASFLMTGISFGLVDGLLRTVFSGQFHFVEVYGLNLFFFLFYLMGYNLRHSHIWLDYGPLVDRFLISPAQHQIHHSSDPKHYDRNIGFIFAFWDTLFGTLYVPQKQETLKFGLDGVEEKEYSSLSNLYGLPFVKVIRLFLAQKSRQAQKAFNPLRLAFTGCLFIGIALFAFSVPNSPNPQAPGSVFLEDLTWMEVKSALKDGYTTAIIPTGGTEQNGPHVILGKHNHIIDYTAGKIAQSLGHTLVAPVITYVPEGNVEPPSEHMKYAGTLSVPEPVFEAVLEATAKSLKAHGFKTIFLLGDSGGNQEGQERVAQKLTALWQKDGVRVVQVGDYYFANGQTDWLRKQGESLADIGSHAGIRDTSELMSVFPAGVRTALRSNFPENDSWRTGAIGNAEKATPARGKILLELKIQAALRQMRQALNQSHS